jgi:hypothetical protein
MTPALQRQPWHDAVLSGLRLVSDLDLQRSAWLQGQGACPDATELVCGLFDDSGLDELLEDGEVFWPELDHHLRVMSEFAERISTDRAPQEVLDDPLWSTLSTLSSKALVALEQRLEPSSS